MAAQVSAGRSTGQGPKVIAHKQPYEKAITGDLYTVLIFRNHNSHRFLIDQILFETLPRRI
jgi:hypothetical protein